MKPKTTHRSRDFWEVEQVTYGSWEEVEELLIKVVRKIYEAPEIEEDSTSKELAGSSLVSY